VGATLAGAPSGRRVGALVLAMLGLSLAGLPLTGGALAKYAIKDVPVSGITEFLLIVSAAGTTLLMLHAASLLSKAKVDGADARRLMAPCMLLVGIALLLPFALFSQVTGQPLGTLLAPATLLKGLLPVALGVVAARALGSLSRPLPEIPAGDLLTLVGRAAPVATAAMDWAARVDATLRRWTVAAFCVVGIVLAMTVILSA
jgi:hypothetical protein